MVSPYQHSSSEWLSLAPVYLVAKSGALLRSIVPVFEKQFGVVATHTDSGTPSPSQTLPPNRAFWDSLPPKPGMWRSLQHDMIKAANQAGCQERKDLVFTLNKDTAVHFCGRLSRYSKSNFGVVATHTDSGTPALSTSPSQTHYPQTARFGTHYPQNRGCGGPSNTTWSKQQTKLAAKKEKIWCSP